MLVAVQGVIEILKHCLSEGYFWQAKNGEALEAFVERMLDHSEGKLSNMLPSASFIQFLHKAVNMISKRNQPQVNSKRSLENVGDLVRNYFEPSDPKEFFDFLDFSFSLLRNYPDTVSAGVQGALESLKRFVLKEDHLCEENLRIIFEFMILMSAWENEVHNLPTKEDEAVLKMCLDFIKSNLDSFCVGPAEPKVVYNTDDIPLD